MTSHTDQRLSADERASLLLSQMTLREKAFQLTSVPPWHLVTPDGERPAELEETLEKSPGHIANFGVDDPVMMATVIGRMQRTVTEGTRLGIPLLVHAEALNGLLAGGHMVFPTPTGLAATWSPDLVEEMADVIRQQMTRVGVRQALSPNMDIALDPRWGRTHETYGEDPYLAAALSVAFTRGLQTSDLRDGVIATAKHFIGYGAPAGGINLAAYDGGPRRTRDLHAFAFEAAIREAGLASVMNSYADVDGVPASVSRAVLTDLLRDTLGFRGFVSSDYTTHGHLVDRQRVARTPGEAGRLTIEAGLDTEFPLAFAYGDTLVAEVEAGRVDVSHIDASVRRILTAKFALGLFENPYPAEHIDVAGVAAEGRELSAELAARSVVLASNDGILPLASGTSVALVGPHADAVTYQFATYSYPAFREMTVYMSSGGMGNMVGIDPDMRSWNERVFSDVPVEEYVRSELGATSLLDAVSARAASVVAARGSSLTRELGDDEVEKAVAAAKASDVVVLALGGASLWFNGERTEGEGSDSADISLPAAQVHLAEAVAATGTPLVVVLTQGRAYALPRVVREASALVIAPYGGPFGPSAVAAVLFGETDPSGRLPYSVPRHSGQIPVYHHQHAGTGYRNPLPPDVDELYLDMPATPEFPFGHGLSYTTFELGALSASPAFDGDGTASIAVTVTNTGSRAGVAVPQLYLRQDAYGVTRPAQQLGGFARVELAAGESATVRFEVDATQLAYTDAAGDLVVTPGDVEAWVALDSAHRGTRATIAQDAQRRVLTGDERTFFSRASVDGASSAEGEAS